jgi:hypothetical protein
MTSVRACEAPARAGPVPGPTPSVTPSGADRETGRIVEEIFGAPKHRRADWHPLEPLLSEDRFRELEIKYELLRSELEQMKRARP